ncbi:phage portal protein [Streptomyces sp. NBC_01571]|uniref:phage portal protein n=1 Tax=Streptomyces sp. NBC_01571 TaxID=2975883 RepID=UPI00224F467D|nr:phage portal protein [Streptomyces sp. NBC_01571]MCX4577947.1 phage portal protein [Streptomyces sp. NBC_01571]
MTNKPGFWSRVFRTERSEHTVRSVPVAPSRPYNTVNTVTAENALGISAVYRAVFILGHTASQLPLGVFRGGAEMSRVDALVSRPNLDSTQATFVEETVNSMATTGNAYWLLHRGPDATSTDKVQNITVLNPHNVSIEQDEATGRFTYHYSTLNGLRTYQHWQVKHLSLMRLPGSVYGIGPIQAAQTELTGMVDVRDYAGHWFRINATPTGILKVDEDLTPELAAAYKAKWDETNGGQRGTAVVGGNVEYQPVFLSPSDAQFLEVRQFDVTSVARMFGIPASKLLAEVNGNSMTYQNLEQANTDFIRDTLAAYLTEIEQALTDLIARGQTVRFKLDALLRADKKTRYETYAIATGGQPFMEVNEVRAEEGLSPMEVNTPTDGNT